MSDMRSGWALTALALVLTGGCVKTRPTISTTRPVPEAQVSETTLRVRELSRLAEEYGTIARQLPGRTPEEHRDLMRQVFAELGQILPLLENPPRQPDLPSSDIDHRRLSHSARHRLLRPGTPADHRYRIARTLSLRWAASPRTAISIRETSPRCSIRCRPRLTSWTLCMA